MTSEKVNDMKTILKVQLSLITTMDGNLKRERQVLIYDKTKKFLVESNTANFAGLEDAMDGRQRAFFECDVNAQVHGEVEIVFGKMLDEQGW